MRMVCLLAASTFICGCHSREREEKPSIEFTKVPPGREGGSTLEDRIEGRVLGATSGEQIVLYAKSGQWWIQPLADQPFTKIEPNSKWANSTHLGTEYAALVVDPGYHPPATLGALPLEGGPIRAVATATGTASPPDAVRTIQFSGYEWKVRTADSNRGGNVTSYDPSNVWTDDKGALHLRMTHDAGKWTCAEVNLTRSLGYGLYRFVVGDTSHLEPSAVLSMITWDDTGPEENHREMDVEITKWGDLNSKNAQFAIQPYYVPENVFRFMEPAGVLTHSFQWLPGEVSFRTSRGVDAGGKTSQLIASHAFTSGVPTPGHELVHINLYIFGSEPHAIKNTNEVVIEKFEYLP